MANESELFVHVTVLVTVGTNVYVKEKKPVILAEVTTDPRR